MAKRTSIRMNSELEKSYAQHGERHSGLSSFLTSAVCRYYEIIKQEKESLKIFTKNELDSMIQISSSLSEELTPSVLLRLFSKNNISPDISSKIASLSLCQTYTLIEFLDDHKLT